MDEKSRKVLIGESNIIGEERTRAVIEATLEDISEKISNTLGPYGESSLCRDIVGENHVLSKDGYTVLKKIKYKDFLPVTILDIIRKISKSLVKEVGDGSTSSVIIANAFYKELNHLFKKYRIPKKEALECLDVLEEIIERDITKFSKQIENVDELSKIACISNNNDTKLGNVVANLYDEIGRDGFITLSLSPNKNTYYEIKSGIEFFGGFTNFIFANKEDKTTCILDENVKIFMCNGILGPEDFSFIADLMGTITQSRKEKLLLIAKGFSSDIKNMAYANKEYCISQGKEEEFPVCMVEYGLNSIKDINRFEDLAYYVNCTIYDKENSCETLTEKDTIHWLEKLGSCEKSIITDKTTQIIEGERNEEVFNRRIEFLEEKINEKENELESNPGNKKINDEIYELKLRKSTLLCQIANLYVGGESEIEKNSRMYLLEDSIFSCKSALKYGYVLGGNLIIPIILNNNMELITKELCENEELLVSKSNDKIQKATIIAELLCAVKRAFEHSFYKVLSNRYVDENYEETYAIVDECVNERKIFNLKKNKYESMEETSVINSSMTDIKIMKSVFSIIGQLINCNQFISVI